MCVRAFGSAELSDRTSVEVSDERRPSVDASPPDASPAMWRDYDAETNMVMGEFKLRPRDGALTVLRLGPPHRLADALEARDTLHLILVYRRLAHEAWAPRTA